MHTNNASLEAFSLCINKEHTMQYAIAGWPVAGCPSESLLERVTNGAIVIHTQRLKSDPGGNLLS